MLSIQERQALIAKIRMLPSQINALVEKLSPEELTSVAIEGEWTVAQNVHHLYDSHANSYIRCKLIATEDNPTLKPYDQDAWAAFPDAQNADISGSLALLKHLHARWVAFWLSLPEEAWQRTGFHPDNGTVTLETQLEAYAAHGEAHIDQITRTITALNS